jgi:hypothetical protein
VFGEGSNVKHYRGTSPAFQSASSGCVFKTIAFLKPAFSKASFQAKTSSLIVSLHSKGVVFSIQQVIGVTGSDIAASGFF